MSHVEGRMRWARPVFVHFRVHASHLLPLIPDGLTLDRWEGDPYVTVAALEATGPMPRLASSLGLSRAGRYRQVNLRTYVRGPRGPGVVLLETLVDRRLPALGARLVGMPYHVVRPIELTVEDGDVALSAPGVTFSGRPADCAPALLQPHTIESFLLDRFWAYGRLPGGLTYGIRIEHGPWHARTLQLDQGAFTHPLLADAYGPVGAEVCDDQIVAIVELSSIYREESASLLARAPELVDT